MDDQTKPNPSDLPRSMPGFLDGWRGDIRDRPPAWRRRPRPEQLRVRVPSKLKKPLDQIEAEGYERILRSLWSHRDDG